MFEDLEALAAGAPVFDSLTAYLQQFGFEWIRYIFARVDGAELRQTFVAGLAHVAADAGIQIVEVDLQRKFAQYRQQGCVAQRHVVGGANAQGCHVAADTPDHIGYAPLGHCMGMTRPYSYSRWFRCQVLPPLMKMASA